jgi:retinal rod rhodopsin-sensitive cGMP 3',5'-cyclic phosphodiesterase subunit delta
MVTTEEIASGLTINWMSMKDATKPEILWKSEDWASKKLWGTDQVAKIPKSILRCSAVTREINFSSKHPISHLRLEQKVFLNGTVIEEWKFTFGFVIPNSTNSWSSTIEAAGEEHMLPAEVLSGNTIIESTFFDGEVMLCQNKILLYYI